MLSSLGNQVRFPRFHAGKTHAGSPRPRRSAVTVPNMVPKYQQFPRNRQVDPGDLDRSCLFAHRQPKRDFGRLCGRFPSGFRRNFSILMALFAEPRAIKVFHFLVRRESIFLSILRQYGTPWSVVRPTVSEHPGPQVLN